MLFVMVAGLFSPLVIERNLDTGQAGVLSLLPAGVLAQQLRPCGHHHKQHLNPQHRPAMLRVWPSGEGLCR